MAKSILYITYDGIMEPLGQSQVLRYLERLAASHSISLISYEKAEDWNDRERREAVQAAVAAAGIHWVPLRYHRRPSALATAFDIGMGCLVASWLVVVRRITIVHARSYVAAIPALVLKKMFGTRFIFDMRGFWADERVERGIWPGRTRMYRIAKWFERQFFGNADVVVSLTRAAIGKIAAFDYLQERMPRYEVITTCTDLDTFVPCAVGRPAAPFTLGYVGSTDTAYLFEPVLECFRHLRSRKPDARMLIITRNPPGQILALFERHGVPPECAEIRAVPHSAVAGEMRQMDASIFFVKTGFAVSASMPTKLGEFLGCGVPCMCNEGVGDVGDILEGENVGVVLREFSQEAMEDAVDRLLAIVRERSTSQRCRMVAEKRFSLQRGVAAYAGIYGSL